MVHLTDTWQTLKAVIFDACPQGHRKEVVTTALGNLRVLDLATLFAGPMAATMLADFGADVIKVEHPRGQGDPARGHGKADQGVGLWWKMLSRNKRTIAVDLGSADGRDIILELAKTADVVIENFRPGTMERWGLSYDELSSTNPGLVMARVTGFGQKGPKSRQPGYGTIAEAMSGFASMTGFPDGPPILPPLALADGIAALATAFAVMTAIEARRTTGHGQVIDMAIIEPILTVLGGQPTVYDRLGWKPERVGNRSASNAPRNVYRTADNRWVALSASSNNVATRVMKLVGRADMVSQPWFDSGRTRVEHADEIDAAISDWIAEHPSAEVLAAFEDAEAAITLVYDVADALQDPQYAALDTFIRVPDTELGDVLMQNVICRLSDTPGTVQWPGRPKGHDTDDILADLGYDADRRRNLRQSGAIA